MQWGSPWSVRRYRCRHNEQLASPQCPHSTLLRCTAVKASQQMLHDMIEQRERENGLGERECMQM